MMGIKTPMAADGFYRSFHPHFFILKKAAFPLNLSGEGRFFTFFAGCRSYNFSPTIRIE
jgi:hypothetical protein